MPKRDENHRVELPEDKVVIELSAAQVRHVARAAAGREAELPFLLDGSPFAGAKELSLEVWERRFAGEFQRGSASLSLLRGLLVLACFPPDGSPFRLRDVADMVGMDASTTHRYVHSHALFGFLEQDAGTREYKRAQT